VEWAAELGHTGFHLLYGWDQWVREQIWAGRVGWDYMGDAQQYAMVEAEKMKRILAHHTGAHKPPPPPHHQNHGTTMYKFYYTKDSPGPCMKGEEGTWKHDRTLARP
jgi:hypothetical protein